VGGAVILRALFIIAGITLLKRFDWITWIFGLFLLYAAWRLVRGGSAHAAIPEWIRKLQPAKGSLLPVILAIEVTDLVFATDSIPAVLAISHNPFVVYTSNIAAVLGLRSLYFALAALLDRFRYLHYGLGAMLAFVASQDARRPLDRRAHHLLAGRHGHNSYRLRRRIVDSRKTGIREQGSGVRRRVLRACPKPEICPPPTRHKRSVPHPFAPFANGWDTTNPNRPRIGLGFLHRF
jgi:hypothetical protein